MHCIHKRTSGITRTIHLIAAAVLMSAAVLAQAQPYPNHPVKFMVGYGAGGGAGPMDR